MIRFVQQRAVKADTCAHTTTAQGDLRSFIYNSYGGKYLCKQILRNLKLSRRIDVSDDDLELLCVLFFSSRVKVEFKAAITHKSLALNQEVFSFRMIRNWRNHQAWNTMRLITSHERFKTISAQPLIRQTVNEAKITTTSRHHHLKRLCLPIIFSFSPNAWLLSGKSLKIK